MVGLRVVVAAIAVVLLAAPARASIRKGPYVQDVQATSVDLRVEVDPPAPAHVELTPSPSAAPAPADSGASAQASDGGTRAVATKRVADDPSAPFHVLRFSGLVPATMYRYRVESGGVAAEGTFTTAPANDSSAPYSFLVYGDNRSDDVAHAAVVRAMAQVPSDFLVNTGDFVLDGSDASLWQRFFDIEGSLLRDRCLFPAVGNHELIEETATHYLRYFGEVAPPPATPSGARLFRTTRWGNARLFFLNGMDTFTSGEEADWLRAELKRSHDEPGIVWRIVVVHHGPWSSGPHGNNPRLLAAGAPDMFRDAGIDILFAGHDHMYERGENSGLKYIVSGGGGAPLYRVKDLAPGTLNAEATFHFVSVDVTPAAMKLTIRRADGSLIETCGFTKGGAWDCPSKTKPSGPAVAATPTAGASKPPPDAPTPSRCACAVPGANPSGVGPLFAALAAALAGALRRRFRHDGACRRSR